MDRWIGGWMDGWRLHSIICWWRRSARHLQISRNSKRGHPDWSAMMMIFYVHLGPFETPRAPHPLFSRLITFVSLPLFLLHRRRSLFMQTLWSRRRLSSISRAVSPSGALAECDAFFFLVVALFCLSLPPCLYYLYLLLLSVFSPRSLEAFPSFDHRVDHFTSVFFFGFIRRFTFLSPLCDRRIFEWNNTKPLPRRATATADSLT